MKDPKETQYAGTHDYDRAMAEKFASYTGNDTFSIGIFQWEMKTRGKEMKRGKVKVRIVGWHRAKKKTFDIADEVVKRLDAGTWDGSKTLNITSPKAIFLSQESQR